MINGKTYEGEMGYLGMIHDILLHGVEVPDRTGVGSIAMFDAKVVYGPYEFPFSTVRPAPLRMAFEEFWFMMNGKTQTKELEEKGINFWKGNTSREFLDSRGMSAYPEGDMGQAYGWQWRSFNDGLSLDRIAVDQLRETYDGLKNDPYGRRHLTTFWNPSASRFMALTPCWYSHQFVVLPDKHGKDTLHMKVNNRSLDSVFGFQYAAMQYRLYQMAMAKALGFELGWMSCDLTQIHIYNNQKEYAQEILGRKPGKAGQVILPELNSLEDILNMKWEDITIEGLQVNSAPFMTERPPMAV
jgi:thymidylate synthase